MAAIEQARDCPARRRRRARWAGAVDGSALEPERGRLAVFPRPRESVFGVRDSDRLLIASAALLPYAVRQRLDQHGAGDRQAGAAAGLRPGWSIPVSPQRRSKVSRPGSTRRRRAPRSMARSDLRRRCSCGGCGWRRFDQGRSVAVAVAPATSTNSSRATPAPWVSIAAPCSANSARRPGSRLSSNGEAVALVRDGRNARHIGPVFADRSGAGARHGQRRSFARKPRPS